jgi:plastocyanin
MIIRSRRILTLCTATCALAAAFVVSGIAEDLPTTVVHQTNRDFEPAKISIAKGSVVRFENDDPFLHQLFAKSAAFSFDSDEQSPGETIDVPFTAAGDFTVMCGIHPKMTLAVHVQ